MSCNPTRILLSNSGTTTMQVTVSPTPDPQVSVTFQVDELGINETETTVAGVATFSIASVTATNNSIWDATIQVGANMRAAASAQAVETNGDTTVGVTITSGEVTYCAPTAGGTGTGTVTGVLGTAPISSDGNSVTPTISLDNDGVTTGKIADEAVTNGKIANLTIQHGKIADDAITTAKIADDAVTAAKIADGVINDGTVTSVTAGSGLTGGTITNTGTIAHGPGTFVGSEEYPVKIVVDSFGHIQVNESESTAGAYRTAVGADDADNLTSGTVAIARGGTGSATAPMIDVVTAADAAASQTALQLGTAATKDVGTGGQNVVQLDNASRLPAVDGSQLTNLPAEVRSDSYTGQIETAADKTYTIDPRVAAARTISYFYGRSSTGTCTAKLYNGSDVVATLSVTTGSSTALLDSNYVAVSENGAITLVISSNVGAENVVFAVEYTQ